MSKRETIRTSLAKHFLRVGLACFFFFFEAGEAAWSCSGLRLWQLNVEVLFLILLLNSLNKNNILQFNGLLVFSKIKTSILYLYKIKQMQGKS